MKIHIQIKCSCFRSEWTHTYDTHNDKKKTLTLQFLYKVIAGIARIKDNNWKGERIIKNKMGISIKRFWKCLRVNFVKPSSWIAYFKALKKVNKAKPTFKSISWNSVILIKSFKGIQSKKRTIVK